jgi:[ribosomal protein S18]-alanine N-acetyltransferase
MFAIRPMTEADAQAVAAWHYPAPYTFYDWTQDPDDLAELLDPAEWGTRYFAVDADGELAGFFVFKPAGDATEIGLGLRPDLTGLGHGAAFLEAGLGFAGPGRFTLSVAAFNQRAITVYERAGFVQTERFVHHTNGADHAFVRMVR